MFVREASGFSQKGLPDFKEFFRTMDSEVVGNLQFSMLFFGTLKELIKLISSRLTFVIHTNLSSYCSLLVKMHSVVVRYNCAIGAVDIIIKRMPVLAN